MVPVRRIGLTTGLAALLLSACGPVYYPSGSFSPGDPPTVWMVKEVAGGRQCMPRVEYIPPDLVLLLNEAGIAVYAYEVQARPICRACSCVSYSAFHYVQVPADDEERVAALGFDLAMGPEQS